MYDLFYGFGSLLDNAHHEDEGSEQGFNSIVANLITEAIDAIPSKQEIVGKITIKEKRNCYIYPGQKTFFHIPKRDFIGAQTVRNDRPC